MCCEEVGLYIWEMLCNISYNSFLFHSRVKRNLPGFPLKIWWVLGVKPTAILPCCLRIQLLGRFSLFRTTPQAFPCRHSAHNNLSIWVEAFLSAYGFGLQISRSWPLSLDMGLFLLFFFAVVVCLATSVL